MKPNDVMEPWREDPIVGEIRAARAQLLAMVDGDLDALFASLTASQETRSGRPSLQPSHAQRQGADAA